MVRISECHIELIKEGNGEFYATHKGETIGPFILGLPFTIDAWQLAITEDELTKAIEQHNSATSEEELFAANKLLPPILQRSHHNPQIRLRDYSDEDAPITD